MDSVEGGSFICLKVLFVWRYGGMSPPPPGNVANLGSLKCHFLLSSSESNFHSKRNSDMFRNECVHLNSFQNSIL